MVKSCFGSHGRKLYRHQNLKLIDFKPFFGQVETIKLLGCVQKLILNNFSIQIFSIVGKNKRSIYTIFLHEIGISWKKKYLLFNFQLNQVTIFSLGSTLFSSLKVFNWNSSFLHNNCFGFSTSVRRKGNGKMDINTSWFPS